MMIILMMMKMFKDNDLADDDINNDNRLYKIKNFTLWDGRSVRDTVAGGHEALSAVTEDGGGEPLSRGAGHATQSDALWVHAGSKLFDAAVALRLRFVG